MNYKERLEKLNDNADERSVWGSIDRPIRPLVFHLNRLGFKTIWSCCGFNYNSEEEPKSHANYTYVVFEAPSLEQLTWLASIAQARGWHVRSHYCHGPNSYWMLTWDHVWNHQEKHWVSKEPGVPAIHDYEAPLLAISGMLMSLKAHRTINEAYPSYYDLASNPPLQDGNEWQRSIMPELAEEWQVEPKTGSAVPAEEG